MNFFSSAFFVSGKWLSVLEAIDVLGIFALPSYTNQALIIQVLLQVRPSRLSARADSLTETPPSKPIAIHPGPPSVHLH